MVSVNIKENGIKNNSDDDDDDDTFIKVSKLCQPTKWGH